MLLLTEDCACTVQDCLCSNPCPLPTLAALQVVSAVICLCAQPPLVPALQLCKGVSDEEAERYCIPADAMQRFHYLSRSGCTAIEGVDDAADFVQVKQALASVSIAADDQGQVSTAQSSATPVYMGLLAHSVHLKIRPFGTACCQARQARSRATEAMGSAAI